MIATRSTVTRRIDGMEVEQSNVGGDRVLGVERCGGKRKRRVLESAEKLGHAFQWCTGLFVFDTRRLGMDDALAGFLIACVDPLHAAPLSALCTSWSLLHLTHPLL